jgi:glycosyltransferase involved in cell wall biosynthesis
MTFGAVAPRLAVTLSFIVPAHNEERELPETLGAIRSAADAVGEPYEIVVVNDDSTDRTAAIAHAFGARVIDVRLRQIAAVRNAGACAARGDIFFFVDADTHITPWHVQEALAALITGDAGGGARLQFHGAVPLFSRLFLQAFAMVYFGSNLGAGAFLFTRRESFEAIGGFDERFFAGEEMYFSRALKTRGRFTLLRRPALTSGRKFRLHAPGFLVRQFLALAFGGEGVLTAREKLAFWYEGKREGSTP